MGFIPALKIEASSARYFTKLEKTSLSEICVRRIAGVQEESARRGKYAGGVLDIEVGNDN